MSNWYDRPKPAPELSKLKPFIGEWASVDQHEPMPWMEKGGTGITRNVFKKALDEFFISRMLRLLLHLGI